MAYGGKRPGSGRKSRAEELGLPRLIEDCIGEEGKRALIEKISQQAMMGSFKHQELLMHYLYGKPKEHIDHTSGGEVIQTVRFIDAA